MKKLILIFAFLALAVFAGVNKSYGQALTDGAPIGISCTDDALHPVSGKPYDYSAIVNPTGGNFLWWATKDPTFISTTASVTTNNLATRLTVGTDLINASANYGIAGGATNSSSVSITWSDAILSKTDFQGTPDPTGVALSPTFVSVLYDNAVCANNLKVYELNPIKAFTVDIRNIEDATMATLGYTVSDTQCIDVVRTANYVAGGTMHYDFGTNTLYYEVIAANFTNSWTPTFTPGTLGNGQTVSSIQWTYDKPSLWVAGVPPSGWHAATDVVNTSVANTSLGVSIYVRFVIANNTFEGIAAQPVTLAIDGVNSVGEWDIENNATGSAVAICNPGTLNDQVDVATQTINPRPSINENVITIPANGNPQDLIPGDETN